MNMPFPRQRQGNRAIFTENRISQRPSREMLRQCQCFSKSRLLIKTNQRKDLITRKMATARLRELRGRIDHLTIAWNQPSEEADDHLCDRTSDMRIASIFKPREQPIEGAAMR